DAEILLVVVDDVDFLGAREQPLRRSGRGTRREVHGVAAHARLVDVGGTVGPVGEGAGVGRVLIGDRGRRPVLVGDADEAAGHAGPGLALGVGTAVGALLGELVVGEFLQAVVAQIADHALVQDVVALGVRLTPAGDEAVRVQRDRARALVLDLVADREHVLVVDRD